MAAKLQRRSSGGLPLWVRTRSTMTSDQISFGPGFAAYQTPEFGAEK